MQGWKIHVSATLLSASDVLSRARPILEKYDAFFKVPTRLEFLVALNSGFGGFSQIGKFLTVYPRDDAEAINIARDLHTATCGLHGPKIPFDARYKRKSLVFYRYASFSRVGLNGTTGEIVDRSGGIHRDLRDRAHAIPRWLADPFNKRRVKRKGRRPADMIGTGLIPIKALAQRGKGGVYHAADLSVSPAQLVIIKEGRRHGESDWLGRDGFELIRREGRILARLRSCGVPVPAPLREFTRRGNRYLVLERIPGRPLFGNKREPAKFSWRRAFRLLVQLRPLLRAIHSAGYVWRDCKPEHIFLSRHRIFLIDFEGACRISEAGLLPWGSRRYLPPAYRKKFACRRAGTLEDDYALGVIIFQFLSGEFPGNSTRSRESVYRRARCPAFLRAEIESLFASKC